MIALATHAIVEFLEAFNFITGETMIVLMPVLVFTGSLLLIAGCYVLYDTLTSIKPTIEQLINSVSKQSSKQSNKQKKEEMKMINISTPPLKSIEPVVEILNIILLRIKKENS